MIARRAQTKETFFKKARIKKSGCWHFVGAISKQGYGVVGYHGKVMPASRLAWILTHGEISDTKLFVCHKCDNRRCINPDHLFLGTAKDNTKDMITKGRHRYGNPHTNATHCKHGHEYTEDNILKKNWASKKRL